MGRISFCTVAMSALPHLSIAAAASPIAVGEGVRPIPQAGELPASLQRADGFALAGWRHANYQLPDLSFSFETAQGCEPEKAEPEPPRLAMSGSAVPSLMDDHVALVSWQHANDHSPTFSYALDIGQGRDSTEFDLELARFAVTGRAVGLMGDRSLRAYEPHSANQLPKLAFNLAIGRSCKSDELDIAPPRFAGSRGASASFWDDHLAFVGRQYTIERLEDLSFTFDLGPDRGSQEMNLAPARNSVTTGDLSGPIDDFSIPTDVQFASDRLSQLAFDSGIGIGCNFARVDLAMPSLAVSEQTISRLLDGRFVRANGKHATDHLPKLAFTLGAGHGCGPAGLDRAPAGFAITGRTLATFMEDRGSLTRALDGSAGPLLDLAEFFVIHRMTPEARMVLQDIDASTMDSVQTIRRDAIAGAASILVGQSPEAIQLFSEDGPDWPDRDLWRTLAAAFGASEVPNSETIDAALVRLADYPAAFRRDVLLAVLEVAVKADHGKAMVALSQAAEGMAELSSDPRLVLLAGMAADGAGREDDAISLWKDAAAGDGEAAHRARLLLADRGLENRSAEALNGTISMLEEARDDWRGDSLELGLLVRLARAYEAVANRPKSTSVMADIIARFPDTPEADFARKRVTETLNELYAAARAGEIPLSDMIVFHHRNSVDFQGLEGFAEMVESFAEVLRASGATAAAAAEYQRAHDLVAAGSDPTPDRLRHLALSRVEALMEGGQYAIAAREVSKMTAIGVPAIDDRRAHLELVAALRSGKTSGGQTTVMSTPTAKHLLEQAAAASKTGDWSRALERYRQVASDFDDDMGFKDAVSMMIAAQRVGDTGAASLAIDKIARSADIPAYEQIATGILSSPAELAPLKVVAARQRLAASEVALRQFTSMNAGPTDPIN